MLIVLNFVEELLICCIREFLKRWKVRLAKSTFLVAEQECVDSLLVSQIEVKLLLSVNRKSYAASIVTTTDDLE